MMSLSDDAHLHPSLGLWERWSAPLTPLAALEATFGSAVPMGCGPILTGNSWLDHRGAWFRIFRHAPGRRPDDGYIWRRRAAARSES